MPRRPKGSASKSQRPAPAEPVFPAGPPPDAADAASASADSPADSLDAALVALQKTFSRLSRDTARVSQDPAAALSLIQGPVEFRLKLRVHHHADRFTLASDGAVELELNGVVQTDIRTVSPDLPPGPAPAADASP